MKRAELYVRESVWRVSLSATGGAAFGVSDRVEEEGVRVLQAYKAFEDEIERVRGWKPEKKERKLATTPPA